MQELSSETRLRSFDPVFDSRHFQKTKKSRLGRRLKGKFDQPLQRMCGLSASTTGQ
jgi:hypothetical protein